MQNKQKIHTLIIEARPRVLAWLQSHLNHLDLAEDCYQEACIKALSTWQENALPDNPAAWLLKVSKNYAIDVLRKNKSDKYTSFNEELISESAIQRLSDELDLEVRNHTYKDDILRLLFCCCHPELKPKDQMALALKVIGGFSTEATAKAFLCKEKTMEQRITRAKKKAYVTANQLSTPTSKERSDRLKTVMTLIYLLFNEGYSNTGGEEQFNLNLCQESIRLTHLLVELFPGESELLGMLALFLFQHSRCESRTDQMGNLLTLEQQDRTLWRQDLVNYGDAILKKALRKQNVGMYQVQAAIAAEHCKAKVARDTRWDKILSYYDTLFMLNPSPVIILNRAVALSKVMGVTEALDALSQIQSRMTGFLHFHTTKAGLLAQNQDLEGALEEYRLAELLNPTRPEQRYIKDQIDQLLSQRNDTKKTSIRNNHSSIE